MPFPNFEISEDAADVAETVGETAETTLLCNMVEYVVDDFDNAIFTAEEQAGIARGRTGADGKENVPPRT